MATTAIRTAPTPSGTSIPCTLSTAPLLVELACHPYIARADQGGYRESF
ncbi:hypothetical protein ACFU93_35355 [Streptomyces sp. NPDC057611]